MSLMNPSEQPRLHAFTLCGINREVDIYARGYAIHTRRVHYTGWRVGVLNSLVQVRLKILVFAVSHKGNVPIRTPRRFQEGIRRPAASFVASIEMAFSI